jgi:glutathione transport system ATP-binding protein
MQGSESPRKFDLPGQAAEESGDHPPPERADPLVRLDKVTTRYDITSGFPGRVSHRVHAAEDVSFEIHPGETLALVGESGSGKSTVGKTLQQLVRPVSGRILYHGTDILSLDPAERQRFKREIQYIFQDPYGSLNPRKTVKQSLTEPIATHGPLKNADPQVVERVSHRVAVMYLGEIVEMGIRRQVFETPQHPYTKRLLRAVPVMDPARVRNADRRHPEPDPGDRRSAAQP